MGNIDHNFLLRCEEILCSTGFAQRLATGKSIDRIIVYFCHLYDVREAVTVITTVNNIFIRLYSERDNEQSNATLFAINLHNCITVLR